MTSASALQAKIWAKRDHLLTHSLIYSVILIECNVLGEGDTEAEKMHWIKIIFLGEQTSLDKLINIILVNTVIRAMIELSRFTEDRGHENWAQLSSGPRERVLWKRCLNSNLKDEEESWPSTVLWDQHSGQRNQHAQSPLGGEELGSHKEQKRSPICSECGPWNPEHPEDLFRRSAGSKVHS